MQRTRRSTAECARSLSLSLSQSTRLKKVQAFHSKSLHPSLSHLSQHSQFQFHPEATGSRRREELEGEVMAATGSRAQQRARPAVHLSCTVLLFSLCIPTVSGLNVGIQAAGSDVSVSIHCSRTCESDNCSLPPLLRYGKYCGILYSGCPGEKPCDGLDACCQIHDACAQSKHNDYLSQECNRNFLNCMERFRNSGRRTFKGNKCSVGEVVDVISFFIQAALLAGRALHRP